MRVSGLGVLAICAIVGCQTAPDGTTAPTVAYSVANDPVVTTVTGGAQWIIASGPLAGMLRRFTFTARQTADGATSGQWQLVAGSTILHGTINCLQLTEIDGSPAARLGGVVTDAKFTYFNVGTDIAWAAVDGGEGANAIDETSNPQAFRNAPAGSAAAFCATGAIPDLPDNPPYSIDPITYGNVQVQSAGN
jgi:hypothetical protein